MSKTSDYNILESAQRLTRQDRQKIYGHPFDDFTKVARLTASILESDIDPTLKHALYMIQVKIARLLNTPDHLDSVVDIAGYANTYALILERLKNENSQGTTKRTI